MKQKKIEIKIKVKIKQKNIIVKVKEMCPLPKTADEILKIKVFVFAMAESCHSTKYIRFNMGDRAWAKFQAQMKHKRVQKKSNKMLEVLACA